MLGEVVIHGLPERPAVGFGQDTVETAQEIGDARGEPIDRRRHVDRSQEVAQEPFGAAGRGLAHDAENALWRAAPIWRP